MARDHVISDWSGRETLSCGGSTFSSFVRGLNLLTLTQLLTGRRNGKTFQVNLREERVWADNPDYTGWAMSSVADGWKCVHGPGGAAVMLFYTCQMDMVETKSLGGCIDNQEWIRFIDSSGHLLDGGYTIEDKRYGRLQDEYGVPHSEGSEIKGLKATY